MPDGKTLGVDRETHGMAVAMGHPGRDRPHPIFPTQAYRQNCIWSHSSFCWTWTWTLWAKCKESICLLLSARPSQIVLSTVCKGASRWSPRERQRDFKQNKSGWILLGHKRANGSNWPGQHFLQRIQLLFSSFFIPPFFFPFSFPLISAAFLSFPFPS